METETQSAQNKTANARLTAASQADLAAEHARKVQSYLNSSRELAAEAERNGLTEEILAAILAEK